MLHLELLLAILLAGAALGLLAWKAGKNCTPCLYIYIPLGVGLLTFYILSSLL